MPARIEVNKGDRYGRLAIIKEEPPIKPNGYKKRMFLCECECGNKTIVRLEYLRNGHTKSCGCLRAKMAHKTKETHGMAGSKLYNIWNGMKQRCTNDNTKSFKYYGAKGIEVCDEWQDFEPFYEWAMENGYKEGLSIDRKNPYKNYYPENCRWIPRDEQIYTRRDMVEIEND